MQESDDAAAARRRIAELKVAHRELDEAILRMGDGAYVDELEMRRLKRRKLALKDAITHLESSLIPDLDA